jgi:hypothetical protein
MITKTAAWLTSDGTMYRTEKEASDAQMRLDLAAFVNDTLPAPYNECSTYAVYEWLIDNADEIIWLLKKFSDQPK